MFFLLEHVHPNSPRDIKDSISSVRNFKDQLLVPWSDLPSLTYQHGFAPFDFLLLQKMGLSPGLIIFLEPRVWLGTLLLFESVLYLSTFSLCPPLSFWKPAFRTIFLLNDIEGNLGYQKAKGFPLTPYFNIFPFFPDIFLNREKFEDQRDAVASSGVNLIKNEKQKN